MKLVVSILAAAILLVSNTINAQEETSITVTVVNVTSNKGKVGFALYAKKDFMKIPVQNIQAEIVDGKSTVTFENVKAGEYAIVCLHDKNENGQMDFVNGRPTEDYGTSSKVISFGPPNFEDAKFIVSDKNVSLNIKF